MEKKIHFTVLVFKYAFPPIFIAILTFLCIGILNAATMDLGNGFSDHGVAVPVSTHRGTVSTIDDQGRNVVLTWLYDHRGGYALLMIDAETGRSEQFPMPFPIGGDGPYASILSSSNKFYTHFGSYFCEFDPVLHRFTFHHQTTPQAAMSMTEDDQGTIWSVTYPNSGVISYNPHSRALIDFGSIHKENWRQYPRSIAVDDSGWIYFGIGNTGSMILSFNPQTRMVDSMLPQTEREKGYAIVYRDQNGKVYGNASTSGKGDWYEFYRGQRRKIKGVFDKNPKRYVAFHQGLFHREFPDGKQLKSCDLVKRILEIYDPVKNETTTVHFEYSSQGADIMGIVAAHNNTIIGGTAFPMFFFSYNPKDDQFINLASYGQWNTLTAGKSRIYIGSYGGGALLEWDPFQTWKSTVKNSLDSNPRFLTDCSPAIARPHDILEYPDGLWIILSGTPGYGYTGGGLLVWDRQYNKRVLLSHDDIVKNQSTLSLAAIPNGKILGGTTTNPGTGGEKKANEAVLYILDLKTKYVEWIQAVLPGVQGYTDLCVGPDGLIYGFADRKIFFIFDSDQRKIIHSEDLSSTFGRVPEQQGPHIFVKSRHGTIYVLFEKGIGVINSLTKKINLIAKSPVPINQGGDCLDSKLFPSKT